MFLTAARGPIKCMFSEIHAASLIASLRDWPPQHDVNFSPAPPARELNHDVIFQKKGGSDAVSCTGISPSRVQLLMVVVKGRD